MTHREMFLDYERVSHHRSMLGDVVRMGKYAEAIRKVVGKGDVVVDLGAGTGILSLMAAEAGASKVFAIERTDMAAMAERIASANGYGDVITVIQSDSSAVDLPCECDVLVSECLGYMAIQENMVSDFLEARPRWLKPGGKVIPCDARVFISPADAPAAYEPVTFWDAVPAAAQFDLSPLRDMSVNSSYHVLISAEELVSTPVCISTIDFGKDATVELAADVQFRAERDATVNGLVGYFTSALASDVVLDTSPGTSTHWRQQFFPLRVPIPIKRGDPIQVSMATTLGKALVDWRWTVRVGSSAAQGQETLAGIRVKEQ